jgi:hypothetical protein
MRSVNLKKLAIMSALSLVAVLGTSVVTSAQYGRDDQKQYRKISKQQEKIAKAKAKAEQQRQAEWNRQHNNGNNNGYYNGNGNSQNNRYRVNRNGRYYNTDQRGAELLRQAVNAGYQQGYRAGQTDRSNRRRSSWTNNGVYSSGNYGYESSVDSSQYRYYFQQGFQKGYQDGYNSRNQYGTNNGGSILGTILGQILNIQTY